MINYPNGKKARLEKRSPSIQPKALNKSNLGQSLEDDVNQSNVYYQTYDLALVHKKPTPITVVKVDYPKRSAAKITEAYYQLPSTTDYNGIVRGIPIDFEAKQTKNTTRLSLSLIHPHQIQHLRKVLDHGGFSFLIIRFTQLNKTFLLPFQELDEHLKNEEVKSLPLSWIEAKGYLINSKYLIPCDYLEVVNKLLFKGV